MAIIVLYSYTGITFAADASYSISEITYQTYFADGREMVCTVFNHCMRLVRLVTLLVIVIKINDNIEVLTMQ